MKLFKKEKKGNKRIITILGFKYIYYKKICKIKNFKTFDSLSKTIRQNICKLPKDIDLIVGIERSGIIPAYIIALFMNKNVCSFNEFINNLPLKHGNRNIDSVDINNVLIVDDSCSSGKAIKEVKNKIKELNLDNKYHFVYCVPYVTSHSKENVDYYFEEVEQPRLFQWNYLNHVIAEKCCFDMDGVLCVDPSYEDNDDGIKYIEFIRNAKPLFIPKYEIHSIVTSRLEKYRKETEFWLQKNNIKYKNLYMLNMKSAEERRKLKCHAKFKADIYKKLKDTVCFIESDSNQAQEIAKLSGKQCICVTTDEFFE